MCGNWKHCFCSGSVAFKKKPENYSSSRQLTSVSFDWQQKWSFLQVGIDLYKLSDIPLCKVCDNSKAKKIHLSILMHLILACWGEASILQRQMPEQSRAHITASRKLADSVDLTLIETLWCDLLSHLELCCLMSLDVFKLINATGPENTGLTLDPILWMTLHKSFLIPI